jgi:phosphate transport system protein
MGGRVETAIDEAMTALVQQDEKKAKAIVANDGRIDALEAEVERWWSRSSPCARRWRTTCAR